MLGLPLRRDADLLSFREVLAEVAGADEAAPSTVIASIVVWTAPGKRSVRVFSP